MSVAIIVWLVWRSRVRYALKAATLSAAALVATPYAFAYDLAVLAIPVAFLARDQISYGMLKGEQTIMVALFGAALAALVVFGDGVDRVTFGGVPFGPIVMMTLLGLILHRTIRHGKQPAGFA